MALILYIITANAGCLVGGNCEQGCALVNGVGQCFCLSGYQLDTDAINCLGMYSMPCKVFSDCISIKQTSMNVT